MSASDSCLTDDTIAALAAGESDAREALAHVEHCDACRELVSAACARRTDAESSKPGQRLAAGTVLGRYRIDRPLGAGGMGIVYLARDLELDRDVAVKFLYSSDDRAHARLVRESQALARLNHPNVVTAHEVGRHGDASYLIMEHVDGGTVSEWIAASPRTPTEITEIYAQAARGLAAAHAVGLVHRDVKPDNVLVGHDGRARVSDFGLVAADKSVGMTATGHTQVGKLLGTLRYMAPEVLAGEPADARSDQWSLCASLWESLFDKTPFEGTTREEIVASIKQSSRVLPADAPAWLRRALTRGLSIEAERRFPSLETFALALAPPRKASRRMVAALVASAALAAGIGATLAARDPGPTCRGDLDDVLAGPQRGAIAAHFASFGDRGRAIAKLIAPVIDGYAASWSRQREQVCRADQTSRVATLRAACLDTRRQALAALVAALPTVDQAGVDNALGATLELPALEDCAVVERLAGRQPVPESAAARQQLVGLQQQYATARARGSLGKAREAIGEVIKIGSAAEQLGYQPLVAEALGFAGRAQNNLGVDATPTLKRAYAAAIAGGDDRQVTDAALDLLAAYVQMNVSTSERDDLRVQIGSLVERLRWRKDPMAAAAESYFAASAGVDDFRRGQLDLAESELRHALDIGASVFGARNSGLAIPRRTLAKVLIAKGRADEAAVVSAQTLDFHGGFVMIGGGLAGLSDGSIAIAILDVADQLHSVGRYDQALELLHQMREVPGHEAMSTYFMIGIDDLEGDIMVARGDLKAARLLNDRAFAALGPGAPAFHSSGLHASRGELLEAEGDLRGAEREYRTALAGLGSTVELTQPVYLSLARCLDKLGEREEARTILERELARPVTAPRTAPPSWLLLAELRWQAGLRGSAIEAATTASATVSKLPALVAVRAEVDHWLATHPRDVVADH